jgi:hypothetical protein
LQRFLSTRTGDDGRVRIITLAKQARSAAAYLLVLGDQALACRQAKLWFHGVGLRKWERKGRITREAAMALTLRLDVENRWVARIMAERVVRRMVRRFCSVRPSLGQQGSGAEPAADRMTLRFVQAVAGQLASTSAKKVLETSREHLRMILAVKRMFPTMTVRAGVRMQADASAQIYQAMIEHLQADGVDQGRKWDMYRAHELLLDYLWLRNLLGGESGQRVRDLAEQFAADLREAFGAAGPGSVIAETMLNLWYFAQILCHRLTVGESMLWSSDAYWLCLIDEVHADDAPFAPSA